MTSMTRFGLSLLVGMFLLSLSIGPVAAQSGGSPADQARFEQQGDAPSGQGGQSADTGEVMEEVAPDVLPYVLVAVLIVGGGIYWLTTSAGKGADAEPAATEPAATEAVDAGDADAGDADAGDADAGDADAGDADAGDADAGDADAGDADAGPDDG